MSTTNSDDDTVGEQVHLAIARNLSNQRLLNRYKRLAPIPFHIEKGSKHCPDGLDTSLKVIQIKAHNVDSNQLMLEVEQCEGLLTRNLWKKLSDIPTSMSSIFFSGPMQSYERFKLFTKWNKRRNKAKESRMAEWEKERIKLKEQRMAELREMYERRMTEFFASSYEEDTEDDKEDTQDKDDKGDTEKSFVIQIVASRIKDHEEYGLTEWFDPQTNKPFEARTWQEMVDLPEEVVNEYHHSPVSCGEWRLYCEKYKDVNQGDDLRCCETERTVLCKKCRHRMTNPIRCSLCAQIACENSSCCQLLYVKLEHEKYRQCWACDDCTKFSSLDDLELKDLRDSAYFVEIYKKDQLLDVFGDEILILNLDPRKTDSDSSPEAESESEKARGKG